MSSRHRNGTGTVYQRNDGSWCAQLRLGGQRATLYGKTKAETQRKLEEVGRQAFIGGSLPGKQTTYELLDAWYAFGEGNWKKTTTSSYRHIISLIRQQLGDIPLAKLTPARLQS